MHWDLNKVISNSNWTEWSTIQGAIGRVISNRPNAKREADLKLRARFLGSLRIDDFFHDDYVGTAESPTTHVQKDVAQGWASSRGRRRRQTECFEVVLTVSRLRFVVTFFCAILRPLSLGYLFKYLRKYPKVDFCFLKSTFSFFSYSKGR